MEEEKEKVFTVILSTLKGYFKGEAIEAYITRLRKKALFCNLAVERRVH